MAVPSSVVVCDQGCQDSPWGFPGRKGAQQQGGRCGLGEGGRPETRGRHLVHLIVYILPCAAGVYRYRGSSVETRKDAEEPSTLGASGPCS